MSESEKRNGILDIGSKIEEDLQSGEYDNFLFVTYGVDPDYLDLFPEDGNVTICSTGEETQKLKDHDLPRDIELKRLNSHAKIYLTWNKERIKCWLGSFNFTEKGLLENIEWVAPFTSDLHGYLKTENILEGNLPPSPTGNTVIDQTLDLVSKELNNENAENAVNFFRNKTDRLSLIYSLEPNTLRRGIKKKLENAKGSIKVRYFTPFINKTGVLKFCETFPNKISPKDIEFQIFTNKPEESSYDEGTFLTSDHIEELKNHFDGNFEFFKRKEKDGGTEVKGREIRDSFLHLKFFTISFENFKGEKETFSIFTSANLTQKAWQKNPNRLEVGVLVNDQNTNEKIKEFADSFETCFSIPDSGELEELDEAMEKIKRGNKTREVWFENIIQDRLSVSEDQVKIDWASHLPELNKPRCKVYFKNIVSGHSFSNIIELEEEDHSYRGRFDELRQRENLAIDFIEFEAKTDFQPPEKRVKSESIEEFVEGGKDGVIIRMDKLSDRDWNQAVVNEKIYTIKSQDKIEIQEEKVDSLALRKKKDNPRRIQTMKNVDTQPHLKEGFFQGISKGVGEFENFGSFIRIDLSSNEHLNPPFDTLEFRDEGDSLVEPAGFSSTESGISYFFKSNFEGETLKATLKLPYRKYFDEESTQIEIPRSKKKVSSNKLEEVKSLEFSHKVENLELEEVGEDQDKFISENTEIRIEPPDKLLEELDPNRVKYIFKEKSLFYKKPEINELGENIEPKSPYSTISYRGTLNIDEDLYLLLPENFFQVKESGIEDFSKSWKEISEKIPPPTDPKDLITWFAADLSNVRFGNIPGNIKEKLDLNIWKNGKKLKNIVFPIIKKGDVFCVPIFYEDIDSKLNLKFVFKFSGETPYLSNFARTIRKFQIELEPKIETIRGTRRTKKISLNVLEGRKNLSIPIECEKGAKRPTLEEIRRKPEILDIVLEKIASRHDLFEYSRNHIYSPIPKENLVLHLSSK